MPILSTMHSFSLTSLYLLSFTLLPHIVLGVDPLYHICSNLAVNATGSPFKNNLNMLLSYLSSKAPPTGFGLESIGENQDVANGLALCRGDVQNADCKSCIVEASSEIVKRCPNNKGAIIWYDYCLLKYSNFNFFGNIDYDNKFYLYNVQNISKVESFNQKVAKFLSQLTKKAYTSSRWFATGEENLGKVDKLYGLVQCTRDLSNTQCKKCLDLAIGELGKCCDMRIGGRVIGGSCNFRYELYPFVNAY